MLPTIILIGGIPSNSNQNPLQIKLSKIISNKQTLQKITKSNKIPSKQGQKETSESHTYENKSDE